jgi:hypothetical protein
MCTLNLRQSPDEAPDGMRLWYASFKKILARNTGQSAE